MKHFASTYWKFHSAQNIVHTSAVTLFREFPTTRHFPTSQHPPAKVVNFLKNYAYLLFAWFVETWICNARCEFFKTNLWLFFGLQSLSMHLNDDSCKSHIFTRQQHFLQRNSTRNLQATDDETIHVYVAVQTNTNWTAMSGKKAKGLTMYVGNTGCHITIAAVLPLTKPKISAWRFSYTISHPRCHILLAFFLLRRCSYLQEYKSEKSENVRKAGGKNEQQYEGSELNACA